MWIWFDPRVRFWVPSLAFDLTVPLSHSVILTVGSVTLEVTNNCIFGIIHPPRPKITPPGDEYEQIFKNFRVYKVSIRKIFKQKV